MVKFLKPNKAVILLQGHYGPLGCHRQSLRALLGCRNQEVPEQGDPQGLSEEDSEEVTGEAVREAGELLSSHHLMPTGYTLDMDLKEVVTPNVLNSKDKKVTTLNETNKRFEERFKTGKNRWSFTKLRS